ncbi:hypothetical protein [Streptomyces sp. NPDC059862]|uniref:hypothetical protein n=1 Tax=unclassified Streptomyces TaxID=2593676 RepID=UPI00363F1668
MLPATWTRGRRGAVIGASAAAVCLGAVLAGYGGGGADGGYVAVGAGGGPSGRTAAEPTGGVRLVPLDGAEAAGEDEGEGSSSTNSSASRGSSGQPSPDSTPSADSGPAPTGGDHGRPAADAPSGSGAHSSPTEAGSPAPTPSPTRTAPQGPAALSVGEPVREPTDKRWCEKVTLALHNTGGTAVRSGTVTFGTHIIGALGIDWGTVESSGKLPAPIEAGARKDGTWTVCVDAWRVPLGMHIETRDVDVEWE